MRLVWTKSRSPLSAAIRWALDADCSHFALVFDSRDGGLMFESNLLGTHPKFFNTALKHMTVVHQVDLLLTAADEDQVWDTVVNSLDSKGYDYPALFYFAWRALLKKFFGCLIPAKNRWAESGSYLCVEIFQAVQKFTPLSGVPLDLSMMDPHSIYLALEKPV